jgi:hypothetical protein
MSESGTETALPHGELGTIESVALELIGQLTEIRSPDRWRQWNDAHAPVLAALSRHLPENGIRRRLASLRRSKARRFTPLTLLREGAFRRVARRATPAPDFPDRERRRKRMCAALAGGRREQ